MLPQEITRFAAASSSCLVWFWGGARRWLLFLCIVFVGLLVCFGTVSHSMYSSPAWTSSGSPDWIQLETLLLLPPKHWH